MIRKSLLVIAFIMVASSALNAFIVFNGGELFFCMDCETTTKVDEHDISALIVDGAENFLNSYSNTLLILRQIENGNINYKDLSWMISNSIKSMKKAKIAYNDLKNLASVISYDYTMIEKVKTFDYQSFFKSNRGLNPAVFEQVEIFLRAGDVIGAFNFINKKVSSILESLYSIKSDIDAGIMSEIPVFWNLNQMYTNTQLFGQYFTQIIYEIKKE